NIKLYLLGDLDRFEDKYREALESARDQLSANTGLKLCICLSYGGRQEIVQAVNSLLKEGVSEITEEQFSQRLYTAGLPDPDLVIRTSGEYRISNFLLWQSAYAEYYFTEVYWPDFDRKELELALDSYSKRNRRFGR
ncbi:MAG: di-trans,poly-cis-decaprenylcistransferase, partial [Clostridia bacterium]|nr:di-trans,poly-cis-decaprenylcistransferase [Clostridia bacterium]